MPPDPVSFNSLIVLNFVFVFKIGILIFSFLYFLFSLIVIRQVSLMTETVRTQAAPLLKLVSILYALFALGVVLFFFMML